MDMKTKQMKIPGNWNGLLSKLYNLRPIRSESAYEKAIAILLKLGKLPEMNKTQSDYVEVLSCLVSKYEDKRYPIDTSDVTVIDILKSFMQDHKMTGTDMGELLGTNKTAVSRILNGKRKLTVEQIKRLSERFKVSTDLFIR